MITASQPYDKADSPYTCLGSCKGGRILNRKFSYFNSLYSENIENDTICVSLTSKNSSVLSLQGSQIVWNKLCLAKQVRQEFMDYFVNEGKLPWQEHIVH